jgi:UDP-N-acetylglucosamine acyltransferase
MPRIHPTAIVDPSARIDDDVEIGPYCLVEADTVLGPGCILRSHAILRRYTQLGRGNFVDSHAVLGGEPQDLKFRPEAESFLKIGDENVFREGVTISRATAEGGVTHVGSRTYWMTGAHAGHEAVVEDDVILANNVAIAGHARIGRKAFLSAGSAVHQYCWTGPLVMVQANSCVSMHLPPYCMLTSINHVRSLNTVGLRRADWISQKDRMQIKELFRLLYRSGLTTGSALEQMRSRNGLGEPARLFVNFLETAQRAEKPHNRGICHHQSNWTAG